MWSCVHPYKQLVEANVAMNKMEMIRCGAQQASHVGPFFFVAVGADQFWIPLPVDKDLDGRCDGAISTTRILIIGTFCW